MKISVTQKNIDDGIPCKNEECPLALAFKDAGFENPRVGAFRVLGDLNGRTIGLALPEIAADFRLKYDRGFHVAPIDFEVSV